jgi:hypothetical protein
MNQPQNSSPRRARIVQRSRAKRVAITFVVGLAALGGFKDLAELVKAFAVFKTAPCQCPSPNELQLSSNGVDRFFRGRTDPQARDRARRENSVAGVLDQVRGQAVAFGFRLQCEQLLLRVTSQDDFRHADLQPCAPRLGQRFEEGRDRSVRDLGRELASRQLQCIVDDDDLLQNNSPAGPFSICARTSGTGGPPYDRNSSLNCCQACSPPRVALQSLRSLRIMSLPMV